MDRKSLFQQVIGLLRRAMANGQQPLLASHMGNLLRAADLWPHVVSLGYARLGTLIKEMQEEGLVETVELTPGSLVVRPTAQGSIKADVGARPAGRSRLSHRAVRPAVWSAFVSAPPSSRRVLRRDNGSVVDVAPGETVDGASDLPTIAAETQRGWAIEFASSEHLGERTDLRQVIERPDWYSAYTNALRSLDDGLARRWKHHHAMRVIETIESWGAGEGIDPRLLFADHSNQPPRPTARERDGRPVGSPATVAPTRTAKSLLLEALNRLPTSELLQLRIPARCLVEVLRPDLLQADAGDET